MAAQDAGLRHRKSSNLDALLDDEEGEEEKTAWTDESGPEEDPSLPFQGKVYLARRKKPDTPLTKFLEVCQPNSNNINKPYVTRPSLGLA